MYFSKRFQVFTPLLQKEVFISLLHPTPTPLLPTNR